MAITDVAGEWVYLYHEIFFVTFWVIIGCVDRTFHTQLPEFVTFE